MAFPSKTNRQSLSDGLNQAQNEAGRIKQFCQEASTFMASNDVSANQVLQILSKLKSAKEEFDRISALSGIGNYAQEQLGVADVASEFSGMVSAIQAAMDWIVANFPQDSEGYLLKDQFDGSYGLSVRRFTPAHTVDLRAALDSVAESIS